MLRISALNDSSCSEDDSQKIQLTKTKEAKEAEAFAAYNKALSHQQKGNTLHAEKLLRNLFDHPLLKEAICLVEDVNHTQTLNHPGLQLLYSIQKNLASILLQRGELHEAMAAYIEAVRIDSSEVTVWFKMGQVARDLNNYPLAKICFQQALQCNPNHWPSLDNAITVTFTLGDYLMCLENISTALEKDCSYPKGLALRKQILSEQPSLERVTKELFLYCDPRVHTAAVDPDEAKEYINEALKIRAKRRQLVLENQEKEYQPLTFLKPLTPFSWKNVGEQLIDLYDFAVGCEPPKSLALEVDLRDYFFLDHLAFLGENAAQAKPPSPPRVRTEGRLRPSAPPLKKVALDLAGDDISSVFQKAKDQSAGIHSVPQFLQIKDNAKESALIRRIQGDLAQVDVPTLEYPDISSKITSETHSQLKYHTKDSVQDVLELEAMDMSDVPLLQEADIDMAVLSLKDIRKADFRPDLLLKTNVEDFSDARSLENVLSSVIDMEMQDMYPNVFTSDTEAKSVPTGIVAASSSLRELISQTTDKLSGPTQDTLVATSIESSKPGDASLRHIIEANELVDTMISDAALATRVVCALDNFSTQTETSTLGSDHSSDGPPPVWPGPHKLWALPRPTYSSATVTPQDVDSSSHAPTNQPGLHSTSTGHVSPLPAHTTQAQSPLYPHLSPRINVSPPPAHSTHSQSPLHLNPPLRTNSSLPPAHNTQAHSPLHAHPSLGTNAPFAPAHNTQTRSPLNTNPSHRAIVSPLPAHNIQAQSPLYSAPSVIVNISPPPAHSSALTALALQTQNIFPQSMPQTLNASLSLQPTHSLSARSPQTIPPAQSASSQINVVPAALNLLEQPSLYSSRSTVLPTGYVHSPITTSLLSPKSSGSCPKSISVYHRAGLTSITLDDVDSPGQNLDLPPLKNMQGSSKFSQKEEITLKGNTNPMPHTSPTLHNRLMAEDQAVDVRSQSQGEYCTEKSSHLPKPHQPPQQSRLSPHHSSPQPLPGAAQSSLSQLAHGQELVPSPARNVAKSPSIHHTPSPNVIPLPQADALTYLPTRYHSSHEPYRGDNSHFLPRPINALSLLEAEAFLSERTTERLTGRRQPSLKRTKPPPLSRSSSLPGYYTQSPEHTLLSYLSPPPQAPCSVPTFRPSGRQSPHASTQQTLGLHPSLAQFLPSSIYPPCSLPDLASLVPQGSLYSHLYPGLPPSLHQFPPSTTLPPYITPPRPPKYVEGYHRKQDSIRPALRPTFQAFLDDRNEKPTQEPKILKQSPPSNNQGHHHYHTSTAAPRSSPQQGQPLQKSPRQSQASSKLQNLARIAQQVPSFDELSQGDHSYPQGRGLVFQAMVESMLSAVAGATSRPASAQAHLVSSRGSQPELGSPASEAGKKRTPGGNRASGGGAKRGPKRKIDEALSDDWANAYKRRSSRSCNSRIRKEDRGINYQNMMKKFFPQTLLHLELDGDAEQNDDTAMEVDKNAGNDAGKENCIDFSSLENLAATEEEDVKAYIKKCLRCHGVLDLIYRFLLHLAVMSDRVWNEGIVDIYMNLYVRLRKHLTIPALLYGDDDSFTPEGLREYATVILTWAEFLLNRTAAESGSRSYLPSPKPGQPDHTTLDCLGKHHKEDMMFLLFLSGREDALGSIRGEFCVRFYWLKARQHQLLNETADAVECFEIVSELLGDVASEKGLAKSNVRIIVPNISQDRIVSQSEANKHLESLQRCKSLEDTQRLYDQAKYEQVVKNLISTFGGKNANSKSQAQPERPTQLLLLVNSLYNIQHKSECMQWAEASLHEAVLHYKRVQTLQLRQDWAATLVSLFACIDRIMDEDDALLKSVTHTNLIRLAHDLVSVIEVSLDVAESVTDMPIGSLSPWKILYRVLRFEETNLDLVRQTNAVQNASQKDGGKDNEDEKDLSPSLLMLRETHGHLGRHSWCTRDDGALLLFIMSVLSREIDRKNEDGLEEMTSTFEQCVYCLYGHPNKRGRARHLNDHNSTPIKLTWERSGLVFRHFATQSVPEFDSYRTSTVTGDVENLLRRIFALVPDKINPGQGLAVITDYIEGVSSSAPDVPVMSANKDLDPFNISGLLYYLLGDFYFKNKEPTKAVKFYQLDLVLNSDRLDSWAGLALAKMSQIEQKLNSPELKMDKPIHKNAEGALRCFRRAVELRVGSCKLCLEYGSLAYQLHSHASRQIKYQDLFSISEECLQLAMSRCTDMLLVAKNSYLQASKCEGEDTEEGWLTFYMMGKVAEKQLEDPVVYLDYYTQAAVCLHDEKAVYPKKIQYNLPPHLALEALEVFYRIHVCSLKLVLSGHGDDHLSILDSYVTSALQGHFARGEEKEEKQQKSIEDEREELFVSPKPAAPSSPSKHKIYQKNPMNPPSSPSKHQIYHKNPIDHEYSRHKSTSDSQSEGEESKCLNQSTPCTENQISDRNSEDNKSTNQQISNSHTIVINAEQGGASLSNDELLNPDTHEFKSHLIDKNLPETSFGVRAGPCDGNLKQTLASASVSDAKVRESHDLDVEEEMEISEYKEGCQIVSEDITKLAADWSPSEKEPGLEVDHGPREEQTSCIDIKEMTESEVSTSGIRSQVTKSDDEELIDSSQSVIQGASQSDSHGDGQVKGHEDDYQMNSLDGSQGSVEIGESSEEDAAALSGGNEADVDTDAMDVDDDDVVSTSCTTSQDSADSFVTSGQVSRSERAGKKMKTETIDEVIEVHAGEDVPEARSFTPSEIYRHVSEGFTPHPGNLDAVSSKTMDIDLFEDSHENVLGLLKRSEENPAKVASGLVALIKPAMQVDINSHIETAEENVPVFQKRCSDLAEKHIVQPGKHIAVEAVLTKDEDIFISQDQENEKDATEISKTQSWSESVSSTVRVKKDVVATTGMDASGDLKNAVGTRIDQDQSVADIDVKDEDEKWETERPEKTSSQVVQILQAKNITDIPENGNTASNQLSVSFVENESRSIPSSLGPSSRNDPSSQKETRINTASCSPDELNDVIPKDKDEQVLPKEIDKDVVPKEKHDDALPKDLTIQKAELISKCRTGLEMCASRFPSHYKSLYRLAHLYYNTKELDKARDILLGCPDWQELPHMPAPGLFFERKQNNFFQGLWKIPVEDIDRSGCFVTHVHRSVRLLLDVLCDLGDLEMLKHLLNQLRRTPESGKKYLRDAERLVLAEETFLKCVTVVQHDMEVSDHWSEEQREENLLRIYHVWVSGKGCKHVDKITDTLHRAFKIMMKGRTDVNRLTAAQAVSFCQQNLSKMLTPPTPAPSSAQSKLDSLSGAEKAKDGSVLVTEKAKDGSVLVTEKAKDGSVLATEKAKDGSVLVIEKAKDGSVLVIEKAKDGSILVTEKAKDGSVLVTEKAKDRSVLVTEKAKDGSVLVTEKAKDGSVLATEKAKDGPIQSMGKANDLAIISIEKAEDKPILSTDKVNEMSILSMDVDKDPPTLAAEKAKDVPSISLEKAKEGLILSVEKAKDGPNISLEKAKAELILSAEKAKDKPTLATEKAKDEPTLATEKAKDGPILAKDGTILATEKAKVGPIFATEKAKIGPILATEKAKDGPIRAIEKSKDESVLATEKAKDGQILATEKADKQSGSKQNEPSQNVVKREGASKVVPPATQQRINLSTSGIGAATTTSPAASGPMTTESPIVYDVDDDVIILSD